MCVLGNKTYWILCASGRSLNVCWLEIFLIDFAVSGCVTSGKCLNLSEFSFLICKMRIKKYMCLQGPFED